MAIAGESPEGGTQKGTFKKGAEGTLVQRGGLGGDQGGPAGDGGEAGAVADRGGVCTIMGGLKNQPLSRGAQTKIRGAAPGGPISLSGVRSRR